MTVNFEFLLDKVSDHFKILSFPMECALEMASKFLSVSMSLSATGNSLLLNITEAQFENKK